MRLHTRRNIEHSAQFSTRRRALFPSNKSTTGDLECVSPLNFLSDSEEESSAHNRVRLTNGNTLGDYDIIGLVEEIHKGDVTTPISTKVHETASFESTEVPSCYSVDKNAEISQSTPSQFLRTPQEISNNSQLPRLIRKSSLDCSFSCNHTLQVPETDGASHSKVRTILFPEIDISLPTQTFYPKLNSCSPRSVPRSEILFKPSNKKRNTGMNGRGKRSRLGQINAGVHHGIKKPKRKRPINQAALKSNRVNILNAFGGSSKFKTNMDTSRMSNHFIENEENNDPNKTLANFSTNQMVPTIDDRLGIDRKSNSGGQKRAKSASSGDDFNCKRQRLIEFENDEPFESPKNIASIISDLENKENLPNSANNQEGSILMSPTSQMCNMASGLVLSSPKKAMNLTEMLEKMPSPHETKLFPVFYPAVTKGASDGGKSSNGAQNVVKSNAKKFKSIAKEQMLLDAGQKRWGATQCTECNFVYHSGDPGDEITHLNYHNAAHILRFNGWKNERVISNSSIDGRIIQVVPGDSRLWWKRIKELLEVINRDLGFYDLILSIVNYQAFIYVKNRSIVGLILAEPVERAHKLLTTKGQQVDFCSEESYAVKCGVSRIWVSQNYRKTGIATVLMDCLKRNFMFGCILENDEIALSSPTEEGKKFGEKYFKTPNFLIYI